MRRLVQFLFDDKTADIRGKVIVMYGALISFNLAAWAWAFTALHHYPLLMGTAVLAYSFGLRHAVDADHIAAIDNVTRKLMQEGKRPVSVGLMFSLGHSTIIIIASVVIATTVLSLQQHQMDSIRNIGGIIATLASSLFLFAIAIMNLVILRSVYRAFQRIRQGERYIEEDFDLLLGNRGLLARIFRPIFRMITQSWHMYPLGFLFGLGFDTATEIGLLGISAAEASRGLSVWLLLIFPVLFTAGMTLIDTTDSVLRLRASGWAFIKPIRKIYYNMTITFISVIIAFIVGGIEALGLFADKLQMKGAFWSGVGTLKDNLGILGYLFVGLFVLTWIVSVVIYKWKRFDEIELKMH
ncbi:MAG: HoxN/HupN/NixA family nickel/cobalt transporter [Betaproteobacteria bacterium]|nr:HoxN/HupN/NixA family nickel/cobalt transporter [Betaproteobacteria bacterium]